MYFDYLNVLVFTSVGFVFVFVNMILGMLVRPKRKSDVGLEVYECGEETIGEAWVQFDIHYYAVALVYVVFAVEIAFLFPWAITVKNALTAAPGAMAGTVPLHGLGGFAVIEGVIFIAILFLGLAYVWAKGDLDWVLAYGGTDYVPSSQKRRAVLSIAEIEAEREAAEKQQKDRAASEEETEAA